MSALRTLLSAFTDAMVPDGTVLRMRFRSTLDTLVTLVVTLLAVVLAVGYQVVGRWARRAGWVD
ncbi:MAG: hypothetical protein AB1Z63_11890 [Candidatus Limnocylindrales bacterium]